jgi:hypothetical protein
LHDQIPPAAALLLFLLVPGCGPGPDIELPVGPGAAALHREERARAIAVLGSTDQDRTPPAAPGGAGPLRPPGREAVAVSAGDRGGSRRPAVQIYCSPTARDWILRRIEPAFEAQALETAGRAGAGTDLVCHVADDRNCVDHVLAGSADLALIGGDLSTRERDAGLEATVIAHHLVVPIVHATNPVRALPFVTWMEIHAGHHGSWQSLGWDAGPIQTVCRPPVASGDDPTQQQLRFRGPALTTAVQLYDDREILAFVSNNPGALGIVGLQSAQGERGIEVLQLDHVTPTKEQLARGAWRLGTTFRTVEPPRPTQGARALVQYLTSNAGRLILRRTLTLP